MADPRPSGPDPEERWADACLAAALFATDPHGLGGVVLTARAGPVRERWLAVMERLLAPGTPVRRLPPNPSPDRLSGGLDLGATLKHGRPIAEEGLLPACDGGVLVAPMAERMTASVAAELAAALDRGEIDLQREGFSLKRPARFGVVALNEAVHDEEAPPPALSDRLALQIALEGIAYRDARPEPVTQAAVLAAQNRLPSVETGNGLAKALAAAGALLRIGSLRPVLLSLKAARAHAALGGRLCAEEEDAAVAARLVLLPRGSALAALEEPAPSPETGNEEESRPPPEDGGSAEDDDRPLPEGPLDETVLAAAAAVLPPGLLNALLETEARRMRGAERGRSGAVRRGNRTGGRPAGTRRGVPRAGARLHVLETLKAAAPWQVLREREAAARDRTSAPTQVLHLRPEDFRITRTKHRSPTTTIFVVDASGSAALHRLAEAKGAVELLLGEAYIRRDQVALIAFSGRGVETLLAPTRSLVRAKRSLAALPGGGATPLGAGIDAALLLSESVARTGGTPSIVLLTDGRANLARSGETGRQAADDDALNAAKALQRSGVSATLIDVSPRPQARAERLAAAMGARYVPLPHADAASLRDAVRDRAFAA